jgi:hypothetical protein
MPRRAAAAYRARRSRDDEGRRNLASFVGAGLEHCARCGERILPGEPWDLDHDDNDRSKYLGPSHRRCNRATAAGRHEPITSRIW